MSYRIADKLWIGGLSDAWDHDGIVLSVLGELSPDTPERAIHLPIMVDGKVRRSQLDAACAIVDEAKRRGVDILIVSGDGRNRAALTGAWYLHKRNHYSMDEAFETIREVFPMAEDIRYRIVA